MPNGADGVYLNNDGGNNSVGRGNVISANRQAGVLIFGTNGAGGHDQVVGNFIGTDASGMLDRGNDGDGISIYGTSGNVIGGAFAGGWTRPGGLALGGENGNVISGNSQSGISIFSPADSALASGNTIAGNLIGTDRAWDRVHPQRR